MKKLLKIFNTRSPSAGFTLIELLVAMAITTIVVGLTGFGVVAITARNKRETFETNRRVELNRALDFIADEVRQAKPIATDASANLSTVAPGFNSSGKTPVLTLQIPGVPQRVIYYIKSPPSEKEPWFGPKVIYRWGPIFNSNGQYQEDKKANDPPVGCSSPSDCNPKNWQYEALVDQIVDTAPSSTPSCPNGTLNPASSITGFYACVDSSGRIADIHLRGKLTDAYNNARDPLEVSTKVFARPYTLTFTTGGSSSTDPGAGTITITQPSTVYFEIIGGDTSGIPTTTTTTTINQTLNGSPANKPISASTKALNVSAATGTTLTVTGRASSFSMGGKNFGDFDANSETDKTTQVWTLRNGYTPPPFNAYPGQLGIGAIVAKYLDANGKIKLAENQVIYLFEVITKDQTHQFYDMQDIVVLATVRPS